MILTEGLSKDFQEFHAVDGVSLRVEAGQVLALLGQNGAGKTTTIRMLTAILVPTRGWAKIAGFDVQSEPEKVRPLVGVLTEQHGLYLRMTAVEYLDFYGQIYGLDSGRRKSRSLELLNYFGLEDDSKRPIGQYSKGMKQKLALTRTLLHEPPVLLLDEPTSAMDPESAKLVRQAIAGLRSEKRAILLCTHNLVEAESLADTVAIISKGKIVAQGTLEDLKRQLVGKKEFHVRLNKSAMLDVTQWPGGVEIIKNQPDEIVFLVDNAEKENPEFIKHLIQLGSEIVSIEERRCTLEEVYLAAMGGVSDERKN